MSAVEFRETMAVTDDTRLAACLRVFQARLVRQRPFEWNKPLTEAAFNFDANTLPPEEILEAFELPIIDLDSELEFLLSDLSVQERNEIRTAVNRMLIRACHEALLRREELVRWIKNDRMHASGLNTYEHCSKV